MTAHPVLYSFRRCPYAMRARLALLVSQTPCEIREVKLADKPAKMVAASPKATVPVLVHNDGSVIDESLGIMRWALERNDPEHWLEREDRSLIELADGPFKRALDRYKYPDRHGSDPIKHREIGLAFLQGLERRLEVSRNLCGEHRGITDAAVFPFVRQFAATDRSWFDAVPLPQVRRWLNRHVDGALFDRAMIRLLPWRSGDVPIVFA